MAISRQEWADWLRSPVTQAVIQSLEEKKDVSLHRLVNLDVQQTIESYGAQAMALRFYLDGLAETLDTESLAETVGVAE